MSPARDPATVAEPAPPPVVAVVVTRDPGPWFDEAMVALAAQDYPNLSVLIIDDASAEDPTARVAAELPGAFVRRLEQPVGFAAAANEVLRLVEGASHFAFCHDDVAPAPDAIRLLVEEAFRSNAGITTPKHVMWDEPGRLLQVGLGADKSGAPAALNERGELDQEQHDAVRDVFVAPGGCMVVRADLFAAIGGFDPTMVAMGEDLDLSWRVQVAGARVVAAPAATVRHLEAMRSGRRTLALPDGAVTEGTAHAAALRRLQLRHRLRTVLKCYSTFHLLRVLPQIALLAVAEVVYGTATGHRDSARATVAAWAHNLRNRSSVLGARRAVQKTRSLGDGEVRRLQARGSARFSAFLRGQLGGEGGNVFAAASRGLAESLTGSGLRISFAVWVPVVLIGLFGARHLISEPLPLVGQLVPFPDQPATFLRHYFTGWRTSGLGSESPAPAAFGLFGVLGFLLFGAMGLLQKAVVLGALPAGIIGAYRLAVPALSVRSRLAAVIVYAANPLFYDSLAAGRWDAVVLYGSAPWVLGRLARAVGDEPFGPRAGSIVGEGVSLGLVVALASVVVPAVAVVTVGLALLVAVAVLLTGGGVRGFRAVGVAGAAVLTTIVLLFPWSLELFLPGSDISLLTGIAPEASRGLDFATLARFDLGRVGSATFGWFLLAAAALALVVGRGWRLAWAGRMWLVALGAFALAWAGGRGWLPFSVPQPGVVLAPAAAALALSTALGMTAFEVDLPGYRFGWRQVASSVAALAALASAVPVTLASFDGRWHAPERDIGQLLSWMDDDPEAGDFRVLWLGDPQVLPIEGWELEPGVAYATSRNGTPSAVDLWPASSQGATRVIDSALEVARAGDTSRLGHLLAPMAIRYVVVVEQAAPAQEGTPRRPATPALVHALRTQVDLRILDVDPSLQVFDAQWAPARSLLPSPEAVEASRETGLEAARAADLAEATPVLPRRRGAVRFDGDVPTAAQVLLSEATSDRWRLEVSGEQVEQRRAFGYLNAFAVDQGGPARLRYATSPLRYASLATQAVLWVLAVRLVRRRVALPARAPALPPVARTTEPEPARPEMERLRFDRDEPVSAGLLDDLRWTDDDVLGDEAGGSGADAATSVDFDGRGDRSVDRPDQSVATAPTGTTDPAFDDVLFADDDPQPVAPSAPLRSADGHRSTDGDSFAGDDSFADDVPFTDADDDPFAEEDSW